MTDVIDVPADIQPVIRIESCELCGCTIEDLEELIYLRGADLITQWELADPRDAWRHTGEPPPPDRVRNGPQAEPCRQSNRPAQSTVAAFWYVVALKDPEKLAAWLRDRERDAPSLLKLLEAK
jgi:hypothetical protein